MKRKGLLSCFFALSILMTSFGTTVFAEGSEEEPEIKEYFSATEMISTEEEVAQGIYKFSYVEENNNARSSGLSSSKVQTNVVYYCLDEEACEKMDSLLRRRDYIYRDEMDSTCSVEAYTQIYYEEEQRGTYDITYIWIEEISGGYTRKDSTVSVVSQEIDFGQMGGLKSFHTTKYPTSRSWSYSAPSSWEEIDKDNSVAIRVGATYTLELKRNAGSWFLEFNTDVIYNNISWDSGRS